MSHFSNIILASSTNVFPIESDLSGNTVWSKASDFQKTRQIGLFGIFKELLSTHNVNVARFARNVQWDFFCNIQTLWCEWVLCWNHLTAFLGVRINIKSSNCLISMIVLHLWQENRWIIFTASKNGLGNCHLHAKCPLWC